MFIDAWGINWYLESLIPFTLLAVVIDQTLQNVRPRQKIPRNSLHNSVESGMNIETYTSYDNQRPDGLYSSALLFCAVALNVLLRSRPVSEGRNSEWSGVEWSGVQ